MDFLRPILTRALSGLLGTEVAIERFDVSMSGTALARGVRVGEVLSVDGLRLEISRGALLSKRVVIKALTIDGPVIRLRRSIEGKWNWPAREQSAEKTEGSKWSVEAEKMLLVGGRVSVRIERGEGVIEMDLSGIEGQFNRDGSDLIFALTGSNLCCNGHAIGDGQLKSAGRLIGFDPPQSPLDCGLELTCDLEPMLRLVVMSDRLSSGQLSVSMDGKMDVFEWMRLLKTHP